MRKVFFILLLITIFVFGKNISLCNKIWDKQPSQIIEKLKTDNIQDTKLNNVSGKGIKENLESIKDKSVNYIEWLGFIGLAIALILIIYNGIVILANFGEDNKLSKAKERFISLTLGVIVLTSGYLIIKLIVSLIGEVFK